MPAFGDGEVDRVVDRFAQLVAVRQVPVPGNADPQPDGIRPRCSSPAVTDWSVIQLRLSSIHKR